HLPRRRGTRRRRRRLPGEVPEDLRRSSRAGKDGRARQPRSRGGPLVLRPGPAARERRGPGSRRPGRRDRGIPAGATPGCRLMRLSAIVVAFGKEDLREACLASVEEALARVDGETELILVVNDRTNRGFAGGVAAGLEGARGEWIALVNDDCTVEPSAL